jgi:hypothetical protein
VAGGMTRQVDLCQPSHGAAEHEGGRSRWAGGTASCYAVRVSHQYHHDVTVPRAVELTWLRPPCRHGAQQHDMHDVFAHCGGPSTDSGPRRPHKATCFLHCCCSPRCSVDTVSVAARFPHKPHRPSTRPSLSMQVRRVARRCGRWSWPWALKSSTLASSGEGSAACVVCM